MSSTGIATMGVPHSQPMSLHTSIRRYVDTRFHNGEIGNITASNARIVLQMFARHAGDISVADLNRRHVERWLASRTEVAPSTKRTDLAYLRGYTRWLVERNLIGRDPCFGVHGPRQHRYVPRGLRADEVGQVIDACEDSREKMVVLLMVQCGLRAAEVASLQRTDIDFAECVLFVNGKGDHQRLVPLPEEARQAVALYLNDAPAAGGLLVRSRIHPNRGVAGHYVSLIVSRLFARAGVKLAPHDGRSGHALRHTCATDVLRHGASLLAVKDMLGHANIATTSRYVGVAGMGDLRRAMEGRTYGG